MNNISINTADALRHMMTLGDVKFVPVIKGGIIHYSIEWVGVSMVPVDEAAMPMLWHRRTSRGVSSPDHTVPDANH